MSTSWLPGLLHRAERATPAPLRRLMKRVAPSFVSGAHRLILSAAPAEAAEATIADGPLRGRRFVCRPRYEADYIFGTHEPHVTAWITKHLRPSGIMFDVGAHAGYTALIAAQIVGPSGLVVAFEPNPNNRTLIARNLAANPDLTRRVVVEPHAVADARGTAHFGGDETTGHLSETGHEVTTIALDGYIQDTGHVPSLIKMDIEGGETLAFDGMSILLKTTRPTLIVEIHDAAAHARFARALGEYGYRIADEDGGTTLGSWNERRGIFLAY